MMAQLAVKLSFSLVTVKEYSVRTVAEDLLAAKED